MSAAEAYRCQRGKDCVDPEMVDGIPEAHATFRAEAVCFRCERAVSKAIGRLTADYVELGALVAVTSQAGDGVMVTGSRELKVPVRLDVMSLQQAIDAEVSQWVEPVAEAVDIVWDTDWMRHTRPGYRVQQAVNILHWATDVLVQLPVQDVLAWSPVGLAVTARSGTAAALGLLELHRLATWATVGNSGDVRVPTPCPRCEARLLVRPNASEHVACRGCGAAFADKDYDELCLILVNEWSAT